MFLDLHRFLEQMAPCSPWLPEHDSYMYPLYHHVYWSPLVRFLQCFSAKRLSVLKVAPLSLAFCGFLVFTNLSLQNNTVGTYQSAKALTTPTIVAIHAYFITRAIQHKSQIFNSFRLLRETAVVSYVFL